MPSKARASSPPNRSTAVADASGNQKNISMCNAGSTRSIFSLPPVLSKDGLEHVAAHKYVPGKYTPLDNLMNPFWQKIADSLPMWLAPNLVTLLGFLPMVLSFGLAWAHAPHFSDPPPRWFAFFQAGTMYMYQTLDAVDGKQARRTGTSSPLGQLFDHGCDCFACMPMHSVASMCLLPGGTVETVLGMAALQTGFFFAQWQEYHTGVLRTSFGPVGVTETQFGLIGGAFLAGVVGPDALRDWALSPIGIPWSRGKLPMGLVIARGFALFCFVLICISATMTIKSLKTEKGSSGVINATKQLLPIMLINVALFLIWDSSVYSEMPRKLCFLSGMLFFYYTAQMILFSMSKMEFPVSQLRTMPAYLALAFSSRFLHPSQLHVLLSAASVVLSAWILLWLVRVLDELTTKLGIHAFKITAKTADVCFCGVTDIDLATFREVSDGGSAICSDRQPA